MCRIYTGNTLKCAWMIHKKTCTNKKTSLVLSLPEVYKLTWSSKKYHQTSYGARQVDTKFMWKNKYAKMFRKPDTLGR